MMKMKQAVTPDIPSYCFSCTSDSEEKLHSGRDTKDIEYLPQGFTTKQWMKLSSSLEEAVASSMKEHVFHHKNIDENVVSAFKEAVKMEATGQYDAYCNHVK
eukprot:15359302-Ditylum_brightwellii.AAC.1